MIILISFFFFFFPRSERIEPQAKPSSSSAILQDAFSVWNQTREKSKVRPWEWHQTIFQLRVTDSEQSSVHRFKPCPRTLTQTVLHESSAAVVSGYRSFLLLRAPENSSAYSTFKLADTLHTSQRIQFFYMHSCFHLIILSKIVPIYCIIIIK